MTARGPSLLRRLRGLWPGRPPVLDPATAYGELAASYPRAPENALMRLEQDAVLALLPPVAGRRVLDLGCGSGRWLLQLAARKPRQLVGCDFVAGMLLRAGEERQRHQAALVQAGALALPFRAASFDLVVSGLVLGHVADLAGAIAEIGRVLAPGGHALYSDLHPAGARAGWRRDLEGPAGRRLAVRHHVHLLEDHRAALLGAGLQLQDLREPRLDVPHPQRGWPAALVLLARQP